MRDFVIVDVETTGGKPGASRITDIALVFIKNNCINGHYSTLVNPNREIDQYVQKITHITNKMVRNAPKFYQIAEEIDFLTKNIANRILTLIENIMLGEKLTEYHTGYRAYTREVLETINYKANSDDFIFDNQIIAQIFNAGYRIAEISCPTKYFTEASSISFKRSVKYGLGVLKISCQYRLNKWKLKSYNYLKPIK